MALNTAKEYGIDRAIIDRAEALGVYFDQCCRVGPLAEVEQQQEPRPGGGLQSVEGAHHPPVLSTDTVDITSSIDIDRDVLPLVRQLVGDSYPVHVVKRGFESSPALEGLSCTYILLLQSTSRRAPEVSDAASSRVIGQGATDIAALCIGAHDRLSCYMWARPSRSAVV